MTITECKYYRDKDKECDVWGIPCSMKKDCYYKQLKRLEQENENLKQQLEIDKNQINYFIEENERLKTQIKNNETAHQAELGTYNMECGNLLEENKSLIEENEKLKEEIKEVKKYQYEQEFLEKEIEEQREKNKRLTCKILEVKALNETLKVECTSQDCTQLRKLHQTLQKIKAIAERAFAVCDDDCGNANKFQEIIELTKAEEE